jgi:hypothetical protein
VHAPFQPNQFPVLKGKSPAPAILWLRKTQLGNDLQPRLPGAAPCAHQNTLAFETLKRFPVFKIQKPTLSHLEKNIKNFETASNPIAAASRTQLCEKIGQKREEFSKASSFKTVSDSFGCFGIFQSRL